MSRPQVYIPTSSNGRGLWNDYVVCFQFWIVRSRPVLDSSGLRRMWTECRPHFGQVQISNPPFCFLPPCSIDRRLKIQTLASTASIGCALQWPTFSDWLPGFRYWSQTEPIDVVVQDLRASKWRDGW